MILVVIQAAEADRVSEGLRAGIGLGLRGDPVAVVLTGPAARFASESGDARIERALRTLAELGRPARVVEAVDSLIHEARAVEVWTSRTAKRRLRAGPIDIAIGANMPRFSCAGRPVDGADLVAQILGSDGPVVVS